MPATYDVVIIGSGAAGGMAAYTLTKLGVNCLMLDAGPAVDLERHRQLRAVYDLPYRGFGTPGRFPHVVQASEFDENLWLDEKQNPYTFPPKDTYNWVRIRAVGGKTLRWGRASWRLSDYEFKAKDHDGFGENWPVSLADLAPYYAEAEPLFRVQGRNENLPQLPDGNITTDKSAESQTNQRFIAACQKMGVPTTKSRVATGTFASSANLLIPPALATGNLQIVANAIAREITVDKDTGKANGVSFVDRLSKREYTVPARIVVVGASTLESCRLLLNSRSRQYPNGLANSSGTLGHYLFDQFYVKNVIQCVVPEAKGAAARATRGLIGGGGYVARFRNVKVRHAKFLRGYTYDFHSGNTPNAKYIPAYGEELLKQLADVSGAGFSMTTMGEVLPRYENFVRINPNMNDEWGIPVLHITHRYSDNEFAMAKDSMEQAEEMCRNAGFEVLTKHWQMVPPGESIHELGTVRMGSDPKKSILNQHNQAHDVKNLFVVDGSSFVTGGAQNPTLTILALSMRASEYMAAEMKKNTL